MEMMFNNQQEVDLLLNSFKSTDIVLEWGSGGSTLEIAKRVKELHSIEHDINWYYKVKKQLPFNAHLYHVQRNQEEASGHDGTLDDYFDYVNFPLRYLKDIKYDVVFIDGRARPHCAFVAYQLLKSNGLLFVHDYRHPKEEYRRYEYEVIEDLFEPIEGAFALWKFKRRFDGGR